MLNGAAVSSQQMWKQKLKFRKIKGFGLKRLENIRFCSRRSTFWRNILNFGRTEDDIEAEKNAKQPKIEGKKLTSTGSEREESFCNAFQFFRETETAKDNLLLLDKKVILKVLKWYIKFWKCPNFQKTNGKWTMPY